MNNKNIDFEKRKNEDGNLTDDQFKNESLDFGTTEFNDLTEEDNFDDEDEEAEESAETEFDTSNIENLQKIDEDEEEETYEEIKEEKSSSPKSKIIKILAIVVGVMLVSIIIFTVIPSLTGPNKSYEDIEEIMINSAKSYLKNHPDEYPTKSDSIKEIDAKTLSETGEMKPLKELSKSKCSGSVLVEYTGNDYLYTAKLNCGTAYLSEELYKKIEADNQLTDNGYGLYNISGNKVFRGEEVNNYVKLDNKMWRIMRIEENNEIVLISDRIDNTLVTWDDRYNKYMDGNYGINVYPASRVKEYLDDMWEVEAEDEDYILSKKDKEKLVPYDSCIGKRKENEQGKLNKSECSQKTENVYIGLPTLSDYLIASTDKNCTYPDGKSCANYNYLVNGKKFWTQTSSSDNTYDVFLISGAGNVLIKEANTYTYVRPVIHLSSRVMYKDGEGTKENPYIIK